MPSPLDKYGGATENESFRTLDLVAYSLVIEYGKASSPSSRCSLHKRRGVRYAANLKEKIPFYGERKKTLVRLFLLSYTATTLINVLIDE